jgi:hypothetical protein
MAEFFWKSEAVEEAQAEEPAGAERVAEATGEASALRR